MSATACSTPLHFTAKKMRRHASHLRELRHRGVLTAREYSLCDFLLDFPLCQEWRDPDVCWLLSMNKAQLAACRDTLHRKGLLTFESAQPPGVIAYRMLEGKHLAVTPSPACKPTDLPAPPLPRWILFERSKLAHVLREDDLFPAERTLCGLPAYDADWQPLPRLNSQPADYPMCCRCHRLQPAFTL